MTNIYYKHFTSGVTGEDGIYLSRVYLTTGLVSTSDPNRWQKDLSEIMSLLLADMFQENSPASELVPIFFLQYQHTPKHFHRFALFVQYSLDKSKKLQYRQNTATCDTRLELVKAYKVSPR